MSNLITSILILYSIYTFEIPLFFLDTLKQLWIFVYLTNYYNIKKSV
ncbi:MAG: hypothetical protein ACJAX4_004078, partial [Clostridium sp.]